MPRGVHFADLLVAGGALALTTAGLLGWATRIDLRSTRAAAQLAELDGARAAVTATLAEMDRRAGEDAAMRQTVARQVRDLQARFPARFSTTLDEVSRARPTQVWLTRFCWNGAEVKAEGHTWGSGPATEFVGRLARSPRFAQVFTAPTSSGDGSAGAGPGGFLLFARAVR
jgi:Fimbrial assembly protein (PilN)